MNITMILVQILILLEAKIKEPVSIHVGLVIAMKGKH
jgi:hypothetical protein